MSTKTFNKIKEIKEANMRQSNVSRNINVRFSPEDHRDIAKFCKKVGISKSFFIRYTAMRYLFEMETEGAKNDDE